MFLRPPPFQTCTLKAGDILEIPVGTPHALYCDLTTGLQFHETVGDGDEAFKKRTTQFLVDTGRFHITAPSVTGGSLEGKVVLVTGANRGLGLGFVRHLAERKAVVIGACRNPDTAGELEDLLATCGEGSFAVKMDLNDLGSIAQAAETVASKITHVDVVLNNAGVCRSVTLYPLPATRERTSLTPADPNPVLTPTRWLDLEQEPPERPHHRG